MDEWGRNYDIMMFLHPSYKRMSHINEFVQKAVKDASVRNKTTVAQRRINQITTKTYEMVKDKMTAVSQHINAYTVPSPQLLPLTATPRLDPYL
jgi:tRNA uridine 5-carbamoylmethylation protein Kti12